MKKKMLAGLLAAAMVMTALTGCGAKDSRCSGRNRAEL